MPSALIVGVDSTVGGWLWQNLGDQGWDVFGTSRRKASCEQDDNCFYLDLCALEPSKLPVDVDCIFLCACMTNMAQCQANIALSQQINVTAQIDLARYLTKKSAAKIIFFSSNAVFNGAIPFSKVDQKISPINGYGEQKANVEELLLAHIPEALILRLTKVLTPNNSLLKNWVKTLQDGRTIEPFYDLPVCPITMDYLCQCLLALLDKGASGIMHISGAKDVSYDELAKSLADHLRLPRALIRAKSAAELAMYRDRSPGFTSLDMSRTYALSGLNPLEINQVIEHVSRKLLCSA